MNADAAASARNLVICCDGTSNKFGVTNTNVVRLAEVIEFPSLEPFSVLTVN